MTKSFEHAIDISRADDVEHLVSTSDYTLGKHYSRIGMILYCGHTITDLAPLVSVLPNLTHLYLANNNISDISSLMSRIIRVLDISNNPVTLEHVASIIGKMSVSIIRLGNASDIQESEIAPLIAISRHTRIQLNSLTFAKRIS